MTSDVRAERQHRRQPARAKPPVLGHRAAVDDLARAPVSPGALRSAILARQVVVGNTAAGAAIGPLRQPIREHTRSRSVLQRAVGFEFQMLHTTVPDKTAPPLAFPVKWAKAWELQRDGPNLEFVIQHTDDRGQMKTRLEQVASVAGHFLPNLAGTAFKGADKNGTQLERIRQKTGVTNATAQPQINADVRIDDVHRFFAGFDAGDADARKLFLNTTSFGAWSKTASELKFATEHFVNIEPAVLARAVSATEPGAIAIEVAKVRGLLRLMFQYLVHGMEKYQPTEGFMKDLPYLSKSNMGLASAQIGWKKRYLDETGADKGSVAQWITGLLTGMCGRNADENVFAVVKDTPKISRWIEIIIEQGDDPLASLPEGEGAGKPFGPARESYPTSLGGLPLAGATSVSSSADPGGGRHAIPTLIVEFRRLPEIPINQWEQFGLHWFDYFENRRKAKMADAIAPAAVDEPAQSGVAGQ